MPTLGSGDHESREENESFGLDFGTMEDRVDALRDAVVGIRDRGYPVWVGGHSEPVRALAAEHADGWNRWGGTPERFGRAVAEIRAEVRRSPFTFSWGGLFVLGVDEAEADGKAQRLGPSAGHGRRRAGAGGAGDRHVRRGRRRLGDRRTDRLA